MADKQAAYEAARSAYLDAIRRYCEMVGNNRSNARRSAAWVACNCGKLQAAMWMAEAELD